MLNPNHVEALSERPRKEETPAEKAAREDQETWVEGWTQQLNGIPGLEGVSVQQRDVPITEEDRYTHEIKLVRNTVHFRFLAPASSRAVVDALCSAIGGVRDEYHQPFSSVTARSGGGSELVYTPKMDQRGNIDDSRNLILEIKTIMETEKMKNLVAEVYRQRAEARALRDARQAGDADALAQRRGELDQVL